jgi:hypothetical protein
MDRKKKVFCRECGAFKPLVWYQRDNPVLSCGHIKNRSIVDDRVSSCRTLLEKLLGPKDVGSLKLLLATSLRNYSEFTDFCPVCQTVVCVIVDCDGIRRCHGNLLTRPGCYSSLGTHSTCPLI